MKALALTCLLLIGYACGYQICNKPLDLVFVVEDTTCLPANQDMRLKIFLTQITNAFIVGNQFARIGFQTYNLQSHTVFNLNDFLNTNDVQSAIMATKFTHADSGAEIGQALNYTWTDMLTVDNGERSCYPTVVVLISFCKYSDPNRVAAAPIPGDEDLDLYWARELRHSGARLITIGVGPQRDSRYLIELASSPDLYYDFPDFSDLEDQLQTAVTIANTSICPYTPQLGFLPCELETIPLDVVFVLDTSTNLTAQLLTDVSIFINNFIEPFSYGPRGLQAALVTYNRVADPAIYLKDSTSKSDFRRSLNNSLSGLQRGDERNIFAALGTVYNHILIPDEGYRADPRVFKQVYIFTAACFTGQDPIDFANRLRTDKGAELYPVQLSNSHKFWKELVDIAAHPRNLYEVQDAPDQILSSYLHKQAWRTVCQYNGDYVPPLPSVAPYPRY